MGTRKPSGNGERNLLIGVGITAISAISAMTVLTICAFAQEWQRFWPNAGQPFATVLGGIAVLGGGALALYNGRATRDHDKQIAKTEHDRETTKELNARFTAAAAQLGNTTSSAIRQAGAYAIAALADDWDRHENSDQKQACIDVLCAYLRSNSDEPREGPRADHEVKTTIEHIIRSHLIPKGGAQIGQWTHSNFNFAGARFADLEFRNCHFDGDANFTNARFTGKNTDLSYANFTGHARFREANFSVDGTVTFSGSKFTGPLADFTEINISATTVAFVGTLFAANNIFFKKSKFNCRRTEFDSATFSTNRAVSFIGAEFHGDELSFSNAKFGSARMNFRDVQFDLGEHADFRGIQIYRGLVDFSDPGYWRQTTMLFDWDNNPETRPDRVLPDEWPPANH